MAIAVRTISTPARNGDHNGTEAYAITSTTAGDLLIACVAFFQGAGNLITGITGAGTWVQAVELAVDANSHIEIWYAPNVSGSVTSLDVTLGGAPAGAIQLTVIHCSGAATASPLDVTPTPTTGTGLTPLINSGTLTQADEIIVSMNSHTGLDLLTMVEDTLDGFSEANQNLDNDDGQTFEAQYKVVTATTPLDVECTYNASRGWGAILASFKGAAVAATLPHHALLIGVGI